MTYDFDCNTTDTTTDTCSSFGIDALGVATKVSSVTAVTDKEAEKAAKQAEKNAKAKQRAEAKAAKEAEKQVKAAARAQAKADKAAAKVSAKVERERIRADTFQRIAPLIKFGDVLATKHDGYITQYVTNANADLYTLLTDIQAFAEKVQASNDVDAVIKQMRENLRWEHEIKTQANSPTLNIIVRYVTRTNRKNACVYARVIGKAMEDGVTSAGLTEYVKNAGGIDKVRKTIVKKAIEPVDAKKAETIWQYAEEYLAANKSKPMASFNLGYEHSAYMADTARGGRFTYFVCDFDQGEYKVVDALLIDKALEQQLLDRVFLNIMQQTIRTQDEVDLMNKIEAKHGFNRAKPLVANAYTGD